MNNFPEDCCRKRTFSFQQPQNRSPGNITAILFGYTVWFLEVAEGNHVFLCICILISATRDYAIKNDKLWIGEHLNGHSTWETNYHYRPFHFRRQHLSDYGNQTRRIIIICVVVILCKCHGIWPCYISSWRFRGATKYSSLSWRGCPSTNRRRISTFLPGTTPRRLLFFRVHH